MQVEPFNTERIIPVAVHSVEFYPSLDDFIHVSARLTDSIPSTPFTTYAYYAFLFINTIAFPAFLWLDSNFVLGLGVFVANVALVLALLPRVNKDALRQYYATLFGSREDEIARVELSPEGLFYYSNGCYSFWSWERINSIEETDNSIFFFSEGNGFAVRKSGFVYEDDRQLFSSFAQMQIKQAELGRLP